MPRVIVIGLDCVPPALLFDELAGTLPTLDHLRGQSAFGSLDSCIPPITVPAWQVMLTGADPGALGVYGFQDRADHSYEGRRLAASTSFHRAPLWSRVSQAGLRARVIGVPGTYPAQPLRGALVTCMLTPGPSSSFTFPPELGPEVHAQAGGYLFDVPNFRTEEAEKDRVLADIHEMTARRFRLAERWLDARDFDLFVMVELGPDRLHHAFWRYGAADHPLHQPTSRFAHAIADYYRALDAHLARLLARLDPNDVLLVASDHGARTMIGGFALNEWLVREGFLRLRAPVNGLTRWSPELVDWPQTRAWADGGYVGRIHLNVKGREPSGVIEPRDVDATLRELSGRLRSLTDPNGASLGIVTHDPRAIYSELRGVPPALIVEVSGLARRVVGSLGHPTLLPAVNDEGPDDANHAYEGVFLLRDGRGGRALGRRSIYDIAPTLLHHLGLPPEPWMRGQVLS